MNVHDLGHDTSLPKISKQKFPPNSVSISEIIMFWALQESIKIINFEMEMADYFFVANYAPQ